MGTQLLPRFQRGAPSVTNPTGCSTGKHRYSSESDAIEGLLRVRKERVLIQDPRSHESHLYPCDRCGGWHLSSSAVRFPAELTDDLEKRNGEPVEMHLRRLQNRIKEQRAQILSMLAVGNGATNRESRKRIASLTMSLAKVTELWQEERRNREALVERLAKVERPKRRWFGRAPA
jgi:hypothetical protein